MNFGNIEVLSQKLLEVQGDVEVKRRAVKSLEDKLEKERAEFSQRIQGLRAEAETQRKELERKRVQVEEEISKAKEML